jgi:hypothetical protein
MFCIQGAHSLVGGTGKSQASVGGGSWRTDGVLWGHRRWKKCEGPFGR